MSESRTNPAAAFAALYEVLLREGNTCIYCNIAVAVCMLLLLDCLLGVLRAAFEKAFENVFF